METLHMEYVFQKGLNMEYFSMETILNFGFVGDYVRAFASIALKRSLKIVILYTSVSFLIHIHKINFISLQLIFQTSNFLLIIFDEFQSQILSFFVIKVFCFEFLIWLYIPIILLFLFLNCYFYNEFEILQHCITHDHLINNYMFLKIVSFTQYKLKH